MNVLTLRRWTFLAFGLFIIASVSLLAPPLANSEVLILRIGLPAVGISFSAFLLLVRSGLARQSANGPMRNLCLSFAILAAALGVVSLVGSLVLK